MTQEDVARVAGVSQSAVSLVLSGSDRVGPSTRQRVLTAISSTGYVLNPIARRLAGGRSALVGIYTYETTFPVDRNDFYRPFLEGVEAAAQAAAVDLVLFTSLPRARNRRLGRHLDSLKVADGSVLFGRHSHADDLAALAGTGYPFAFIGRREVPGATVPYVGADYAQATVQVVRHLHALEHRRIGLAVDSTPAEAAADRLRGLSLARQELGFESVTIEVAEVECDADQVVLALLRDGVTAVIATADLAADLLAAASRLGIRVPEDLSIARLGDPERPADGGPTWTGFAIPRLEMGRRAFELVVRQIDALSDDESDALDRQVLVPCDITFGDTTTSPTREMR